MVITQIDVNDVEGGEGGIDNRTVRKFGKK